MDYKNIEERMNKTISVYEEKESFLFEYSSSKSTVSSVIG